MKVLIISPAYFPAFHYGGPIYSTHDLARILSNLGYSVYVLATQANGKAKLNVDTRNSVKLGKCYYVRYFKTIGPSIISLRLLINLFSHIKKNSFIYLVSVFTYTTPITIFINNFLKRKLIIAPKGQLAVWSLNQGSKFKNMWLKIFIKPYINKLVWHSASQQETDDILRLFKNAKVVMVPHVLNVFEFNLSKTLDKSIYERLIGESMTNKKVIVSLSSLHKKKGYDILIKALNILIKSQSDLILIIAGNDFGEKESLVQLVHRLNLSDKVFIIERIDGEDKKLFLTCADLFALPSHNENFGLVYAEALAAGTPIVASKNTPWEDVEKYDCGKFVENTAEAFADAIDQILSSDYVSMGKRGRKYILDNFSHDVISKRYLELFSILTT